MFYLSQTEDYNTGDTDSRSNWIVFHQIQKQGRLIEAEPTKWHKLSGIRAEAGEK